MSQQHGISLGIERIYGDFLMHVKAFGKLTHEDYLTMMPIIDATFAHVEHPRIKVLADVTKLEGWELQAAWDDLKLGVKYGSNIERVAVVGSKGWQELLMKVAGWFMDAEVKTFTEINEAKAWLLERSEKD